MTPDSKTATDLEITAPVPGDGAAIYNIAQRNPLFSAEEVACVEELWQEMLRLGPEASGYHFLVARWQGQVIGFACYGLRALTEGAYDLYWIAVDPGHHRHGAGRALMRQAEQEIRTLGGRLVIVETSGQERYAPTRRFYLGVGYIHEATLRDFYHPGDDLVIFTRHLNA